MDNSKLQASIMAHEGLRLKAYIDTAGKTTIGYGRNISDDGISQSEAVLLLANDMQSCIAQAEGEPWWPVVVNDDVRSRAMVELVFNLGIGKLRGFVNALSALGGGDFEGAAAGFLDSEWAREVGNRAAVLTEMIRTGVDIES
jgi:lysozyme